MSYNQLQVEREGGREREGGGERGRERDVSVDILVEPENLGYWV
jgi:hypothetical protein